MVSEYFCNVMQGADTDNISDGEIYSGAELTS